MLIVLAALVDDVTADLKCSWVNLHQNKPDEKCSFKCLLTTLEAWFFLDISHLVIRVHEMLHLAVQQILGHQALCLGAGECVGEEEDALAAVDHKQVVRDVGCAQPLARLSHHGRQLIDRVARLKHQPAHLQACAPIRALLACA